MKIERSSSGKRSPTSQTDSRRMGVKKLVYKTRKAGGEGRGKGNYLDGSFSQDVDLTKQKKGKSRQGGRPLSEKIPPKMHGLDKRSYAQLQKRMNKSPRTLTHKYGRKS